MTQKRNNKNFLLFAVLTVSMRSLEALSFFSRSTAPAAPPPPPPPPTTSSSSIFSKAPKAVLEDMSDTTRKVATQLVKDVEAKKAENASQTKWSMSMKWGGSAPTDSQADLNEIAAIYQALNYADIAALDYLKNNCEQSGGAFAAAMDPVLCGEYISTMYKTVEGRVSAITAQYALSKGLLNAPPEWPEHASEVLNILQKYDGSNEVIYGAERGLLKKLKDQSEGKVEESMIPPHSASPVEKMRAPVILSDPNQPQYSNPSGNSSGSSYNNYPNSGQPAPYSGQSGPYNGQSGPYNGQPAPYSGQSGPYNGQSGTYGGSLYPKDARWDYKVSQGYGPPPSGYPSNPPPPSYPTNPPPPCNSPNPPAPPGNPPNSSNPYPPPPPPTAPAPMPSNPPGQSVPSGHVMLLVPSSQILPYNGSVPTTLSGKTDTQTTTQATPQAATKAATQETPQAGTQEAQQATPQETPQSSPSPSTLVDSHNTQSTSNNSSSNSSTDSSSCVKIKPDRSDIRWLIHNYSKSDSENK